MLRNNNYFNQQLMNMEETKKFLEEYVSIYIIDYIDYKIDENMSFHHDEFFHHKIDADWCQINYNYVSLISRVEVTYGPNTLKIIGKGNAIMISYEGIDTDSSLTLTLNALNEVIIAKKEIHKTTLKLTKELVLRQ